MLKKIESCVEKCWGLIVPTLAMLLTMEWAWMSKVLLDEYNGMYVSGYPMLERILYLVVTSALTLMWERVYKMIKG